MASIPYTAIPAPSKYDLGVFLLRFNSRKDGLTMRKAFKQDFDIDFPDYVVSYGDAIHYIMSLR